MGILRLLNRVSKAERLYTRRFYDGTFWPRRRLRTLGPRTRRRAPRGWRPRRRVAGRERFFGRLDDQIRPAARSRRGHRRAYMPAPLAPLVHAGRSPPEQGAASERQDEA